MQSQYRALHYSASRGKKQNRVQSRAIIKYWQTIKLVFTSLGLWSAEMEESDRVGLRLPNTTVVSVSQNSLTITIGLSVKIKMINSQRQA